MKNESLLLLRRAISGDKNAFGELYGLYYTDMYRFALFYLGSKADAEDTVNDAVLSVWKSVDKISDCEKFKHYLFKALSNCCKKSLRHIYKTREQIDFDGLLLSDGKDYTYAAEVYEMLNVLKPDERKIISMSVMCGYTSNEIAASLNIPAATVRSKQSRALQKLRLYYNAEF